MRLEHVNVEDVVQIARWNVELHEDEGSTPMTIETAENRLRKWIADDSFQILTIRVDGQSVGYIVYQVVAAIPDLRGSVESIYVRQFYIIRKARRSGYGRKAMELFTRHVVNGTQPLHLDVKISNPVGQRFWESLGFVAEHVAYTRESHSRSTNF